MSTLSVLLQLAFWSALACVGATSLHTIVPSVDGVPGKCIFRVQKEDGSLISYDFSKHMHDLVSDDLEGYRVKMNLCGEVAASCYPSTCSKQDGAHAALRASRAGALSCVQELCGTNVLQSVEVPVVLAFDLN